jgi:hypothetical protein
VKGTINEPYWYDNNLDMETNMKTVIKEKYSNEN